jgi:hypothetical protein
LSISKLIVTLFPLADFPPSSPAESSHPLISLGKEVFGCY